MLGDPKYKSFVQMFVMCVAISFITHISACLWVLVGRIGDMQREDNENRSFDDWKGPYTFHGSAYLSWNTNWLQAQG